MSLNVPAVLVWVGIQVFDQEKGLARIFLLKMLDSGEFSI